VEPFANFMDLGERKDPSSISDLFEPHSYVEDLNDARTPLAGFVNSLLGRTAHLTDTAN
jgi:hypothetical protein